MVEDPITRKGIASEPKRPRLVRSRRGDPGPRQQAKSAICRGTGEESDALVVPMKHPNKAVMALGDRVWAVAEGVEGRGAAGGSVDRQASPGRRTGIGMPLKRVAHGSRLRADEKASDAITSDLRQEPGAGKPHAGICAGAVSNHRPYRDRREAGEEVVVQVHYDEGIANHISPALR